MEMADFRELIINQREKTPVAKWTGSMLEYLYKVQENPDIATFAPGRIYNMIMSYGVDQVDESLKTRGYEDLVKYKFFDEKIYGSLESIHDLMKFLKASARRTETGKRVLLMVGPVSSGKSTISALIKRGLERDPIGKFVIDGCPINEEPLHLIPLANREEWEKKLNVNIEGDLCPVCQQMVKEKFMAEFCCDVKSRSEEFGTDLRHWIDDTATLKYGFTESDMVYKKIMRFVNMLCGKPFDDISK